jgi:hypothetical protein
VAAQVVSSGLQGFWVQGVKQGLAHLRVNNRLRGFLLHLRARDILKYFYGIFKE